MGWYVGDSVCYLFKFFTFFVFFFNDTATTEIYTYLHTLSLHDALPIYPDQAGGAGRIAEQCAATAGAAVDADRAADRIAERQESAVDCRDRKSTRLNSSH